jgi:hypothetical protein
VERAFRAQDRHDTQVERFVGRMEQRHGRDVDGRRVDGRLGDAGEGDEDAARAPSISGSARAAKTPSHGEQRRTDSDRVLTRTMTIRSRA